MPDNHQEAPLSPVEKRARLAGSAARAAARAPRAAALDPAERRRRVIRGVALGLLVTAIVAVLIIVLARYGG